MLEVAEEDKGGRVEEAEVGRIVGKDSRGCSPPGLGFGHVCSGSGGVDERDLGERAGMLDWTSREGTKSELLSALPRRSELNTGGDCFIGDKVASGESKVDLGELAGPGGRVGLEDSEATLRGCSLDRGDFAVEKSKTGEGAPKLARRTGDTLPREGLVEVSLVVVGEVEVGEGP